jgi:hypothetical protein
VVSLASRRKISQYFFVFLIAHSASPFPAFSPGASKLWEVAARIPSSGSLRGCRSLIGKPSDAELHPRRLAIPDHGVNGIRKSLRQIGQVDVSSGGQLLLLDSHENDPIRLK